MPLEFQITKLDHCPVSNATPYCVPADACTETVEWNGADWSLKARTASLDPVSEYLGSCFFAAYGLPVQEVALASRNDNLVAACRAMCIAPTKLIPFGEASGTTDLSAVTDLVKTDETFSTVPALGLHIWYLILTDALTGNDNRGPAGFGIVKDAAGHTAPAPVFANGHAFGGELSDLQIAGLLLNEKELSRYAMERLTGYIKDGKDLNAKELLTLNVPEMKEALHQLFPYMHRAVAAFYKVLDQMPDTVCSADRKRFIRKVTDLRMNRIFVPVFALEQAMLEERTTKARAMELYDRGLFQNETAGIGSYRHYGTLHQYLFSNLYDYAGKLRTEDIKREGIPVAPVSYLNDVLENIEEMPDQTFPEIVEKYVALLMAHPFHDGNSRTARLWLNLLLADRLGKAVDWTKVNEEAYNKILPQAFTEEEKLAALLSESLTEAPLERSAYATGIDASWALSGFKWYKAETLTL